MSDTTPPIKAREAKTREDWLAQARTLSEALPYMRRHSGETFVIKYGGHAMGDDALARLFAADMVLLRQVGMIPLVVHGGGPQIGAMLSKLGIKSEFAAGLRITDKATVEIVEMVLAGSINKQIVGFINAEGGHAVANVADVACIDEVQAAVACAVDTFGDLHFAVNNAGIGGDQSPAGELDPAAWRRVIDVNLNGVFYGLRHQIPAILRSGGGAIVNVSSILGVVGDAANPAYVAAKHAVTGLTRSAALAYASKGIRINSIHPGYVRTPILDFLDESALQEAVGLHPIGRLGTPDEIAHAVAFLLSEGSSFLAGTQLIADGGADFVSGVASVSGERDGPQPGDVVRRVLSAGRVER